jgi:hypothetical protein
MIKNINLKTVVIYTVTATGMIAIVNPVTAIAEGYLSPIEQSAPTKLLADILASADADYNFFGYFRLV